MMFYTVGVYRPHYGDLLVRAPSSASALTKARQAGFTPNPGDRYLVPSSGQFPEEHIMSYNNEDLPFVLEHARSTPDESVFVIWSQER